MIRNYPEYGSHNKVSTVYVKDRAQRMIFGILTIDWQKTEAKSDARERRRT